MQHCSQKCQASPPTLCSLSSTGPDWSTVTGCIETMCHISLFEECLWTGYPTSHAEARSVAKRGRDSSTEFVSSPHHPAQSPLGPTHHMLDHVPPARKDVRAAVSATSPDDADVSSAPMPSSPLPLGLAR